VAVTFLSPEWAQALKTQLNADDVFTKAAADQHATIQQIITTDEGETHYWIRVDGGTIDMGIGDAETPDATIRQSYATAVALSKSELSPVTAFMTGKIKVAGNMGMLLSLQGSLAQLPAAIAAIDVQY
jgi:putative sterol carrier protein